MRSFIVALMIALSGCGALIPEHFTPSHDQTKPITIWWQYVDDIDKVCREVGVKQLPYPLVVVEGCAVLNKERTRCIIFTAKNTSTAIVGHELRHCFEGHFH